jgi:hypothetical protein
MRILFINNGGGGFADHIEVSAGTTVRQLFEQQIQGKPDGYLIRVNRLPASADQQLQEGDRVSITPTKIEGAQVSPGATALYLVSIGATAYAPLEPAAAAGDSRRAEDP